MRTQIIVNNSTVNVSTEQMNEQIARFLNVAKQVLEKTNTTAQDKATRLAKHTTMLLFDLLGECKGDINVSYNKDIYENIGTQDYNVHGYSTELDVYIDIYITD